MSKIMDSQNTEFLSDIVTWAEQVYKLPVIKFSIGHSQAGSFAGCKMNRTTGKTQYRIRITNYWFLKYGIEACVADLLHEIAHIVHKEQFKCRMSHNADFRHIEIQLLSEFDLVPKDYKRAYFKRLETKSGRVIYIY